MPNIESPLTVADLSIDDLKLLQTPLDNPDPMIASVILEVLEPLFAYSSLYADFVDAHSSSDDDYGMSIRLVEWHTPITLLLIEEFGTSPLHADHLTLERCVLGPLAHLMQSYELEDNEVIDELRLFWRFLNRDFRSDQTAACLAWLERDDTPARFNAAQSKPTTVH